MHSLRRLGQDCSTRTCLYGSTRLLLILQHDACRGIPSPASFNGCTGLNNSMPPPQLAAEFVLCEVALACELSFFLGTVIESLECVPAGSTPSSAALGKFLFVGTSIFAGRRDCAATGSFVTQ